MTKHQLGLLCIDVKQAEIDLLEWTKLTLRYKHISIQCLKQIACDFDWNRCSRVDLVMMKWREVR